MEVHNAVSPTEAQIKEFFEPDAKSPIYMVNLLKFHERALSAILIDGVLMKLQEVNHIDRRFGVWLKKFLYLGLGG